jgi:AcrR family transcriptional regulator
MTGHRSNQGSDKSHRLREVALELFARQGFEATTIDDLVVAADCGKGTFYRYFPNKEALLDQLLEDHFARLGDAIEQAVTANRPLPDKLLAASRAYVAVARHDRRLLRILEEVKVRMCHDLEQKLFRALTPQYVLLCSAIEAEIAAGRFRPLAPSLFLLALLGALHMLLFREIRLGRKATDSDLKQVLSIMLQGAMTTP